jgi:hypothetical protein
MKLAPGVVSGKQESQDFLCGRVVQHLLGWASPANPMSALGPGCVKTQKLEARRE